MVQQNPTPIPKVTLRDYLEFRFDALEERLSGYCEKQEKLEVRMRALERVTPWQWVAQAVVAIAAMLGIGTGYKN